MIDPIYDNSSLAQFQKEAARRRRVFIMARAYLQRGIQAGIPERFLRVNRTKFSALLSEDYYGDIEPIVSQVYDHPRKLLSREFILVDGGTIESRKEAGFVLLFRMIVCDKFGLYQDCRDIVHKFQTSLRVNFNRSEYAAMLKTADALFISEFSPEVFSPHLDTGDFFDEIIGYRYDMRKPTIISFASPIHDKNSPRTAKADAATDLKCGHYLRTLSGMTPIEEYQSLRIRVKAKKNGRNR